MWVRTIFLAFFNCRGELSVKDLGAPTDEYADKAARTAELELTKEVKEAIFFASSIVIFISFSLLYVEYDERSRQILNIRYTNSEKLEI